MKIHEIMNNKGSREETRHVGQLEENAFLENGFNGGSFAPYVRNHRKIEEPWRWIEAIGSMGINIRAIEDSETRV